MLAQRSPQIVEMLRRAPARVVFDTADYPLRSGVRRRDVTSRHLIYRIEELCLDLRLERDPASRRAALVGQLTRPDAPALSFPSLPVFLQSGDRQLARACTNRWGEFQLDYEAESPMTLFLRLDRDRLVELAVDRRTTRRSEERAQVACWA